MGWGEGEDSIDGKEGETRQGGRGRKQKRWVGGRGRIQYRRKEGGKGDTLQLERVETR